MIKAVAACAFAAIALVGGASAQCTGTVPACTVAEGAPGYKFYRVEYAGTPGQQINHCVQFVIDDTDSAALSYWARHEKAWIDGYSAYSPKTGYGLCDTTKFSVDARCPLGPTGMNICQVKMGLGGDDVAAPEALVAAQAPVMGPAEGAHDGDSQQDNNALLMLAGAGAGVALAAVGAAIFVVRRRRTAAAEAAAPASDAATGPLLQPVAV